MKKNKTKKTKIGEEEEEEKTKTKKNVVAVQLLVVDECDSRGAPGHHHSERRCGSFQPKAAHAAGE